MSKIITGATLRQRFADAVRAFQGKPKRSIALGLEIKRCSECERAERPHGRWLKTDAYPHAVFCSVCFKNYVTNEEIIDGRSLKPPIYCTEAEYCPHCGAMMEREAVSE